MLETQMGSEQMSQSGGRRTSFGRISRPHLSSVQNCQMEVEGTTMLCFPTDHSWFQGTINTDDDSSYSILGERLQETEGVAGGNNNKGEDSTEEEGPIYKVTLTDHFTGLTYQLPNIHIHLDPSSPSLLTCSQDAQVRFKVEHVYRGQKADMMLQQYTGGSSSLLGKSCLLYSGPISLLFNETVSTGRNWCL